MVVIDEHIRGIRTALGIGTSADATFPLSPLRRYGNDLCAIARAVADTLERCPQVLSGLGTEPMSLRGREERTRQLAAAREAVTLLLVQIREELRGATGELARDTDLAMSAINRVLMHPGTEAGVRQALRSAARPALALLEARHVSIEAARRRTLSERGGRAEACRGMRGRGTKTGPWGEISTGSMSLKSMTPAARRAARGRRGDE